MKKRLEKHKPKLRYLFVGGLNTLVGLSAYPVLYFALEQFALHYMVILVISQVFCVISAFFTNKFLVFRTKGNYIVEFLKFSSFYMAYFVINVAAMPVLVEMVKVHPAVSQVFISIGIIITSYFWHSRVTFAKKRKK